MSDIHDHFEPVMLFDRDSRDFVLGFEAGDIYQRARRFADGEAVYEDDPPGIYRDTVHVENAEMMLRIAETHRLAIHSEDINDDWIQVVFQRTDDSEGQA